MLGFRPRGQRVAPKSTIEIREMAEIVRRLLNIEEHETYVDLLRIAERTLFECGLVFKVGEIADMGTDEGSARPDVGEISLREDVYHALHRHEHRARFTFPHEIGHLFLHRGIALGRSTATSAHRPCEDSEWQADSFAAEFMAPVELVQKHCKRASDIMKNFGISMDAAITRRNVLRRERLIRW